jgi:hypothetical protein
MNDRIQGICDMLNTEDRKIHWVECVRKMREETTPPQFIKRVIYETKADLQAARQIAAAAAAAAAAEAENLQARRQAVNRERGARSARRSRIASKIVDEETKNVNDIDAAPLTRDLPVDSGAITRATDSAPERIEDEIATRELRETFEEHRARNERGYQAAFPQGRRLGIGPPSRNCKSNNKGKSGCSIQGGRYKSSRKTRKARKASKKNTRRK